MSWISVKDYAEQTGKSRQAVLKAISKGKLTVHQIEAPGARGLVYEVWADNQELTTADNQCEEDIKKTLKGDDHIADASKMIVADDAINATTEVGQTHRSAPTEEGATCKDYLQVQPASGTQAVLSSGDAGTPETGLSLVALSEKQEFESYPVESREVAYARLEIVKMWIAEKQRAKIDKIQVGRLEKAFLKQLQLGKICYDATQRLSKNGELKLSIRSIYRWEKSWKDHDTLYPISLTDKWNRNKADKDMQYVRTYIKMQAADPRGHQITDIMRNAQNSVPGFDLSYRSVARLVQETRKDKFLGSALTGKTAWKNNARPHIRRINDCEPGDMYESDGKTMNVLVMSPFWFHNDKAMRYLVRPVMVCWLDIATWTITGWATWQSESWHLVRTAFTDAMSKTGVPRRVTYDGGGAFFNVYTDPQHFAAKKKESASTRKARELLAKGYKGFYEHFGVEKKIKAIPGNSESKQIEPAWGDIFGEWEKRQFAYVGKDFTARPEWMRMTNLKLMKTYKDKIMTWDEYVNSVGEFINEWNNRPRASLKRLDGSIASPIECFMEFPENMRKPAMEVVEHVCWHPRKVAVQRDGVYIDGLLYRHPAFGLYLGKSVLVEYDERNRFECTIATMSGEKLAQPARLVIPGMHMDDEQSQLAMIDRAHYEKELKAVYLARVNHGDSITIQELNSLTARVDLLMQDQSRRQESDKSATMIPQTRTSIKNKATKEIENIGFEIAEDDLDYCPLSTNVEEEQDEDDLLIAEINNDLNTIGIRSIK